jgi:cellulose synthase/poly-beta-1,6-N-acetylglucosamine synthase-like glycosyltransferase
MYCTIAYSKRLSYRLHITTEHIPNKIIDINKKICCLVPVYQENASIVQKTIDSIITDMQGSVDIKNSKIIIIIDNMDRCLVTSLLETYMTDLINEENIYRDYINLLSYGTITINQLKETDSQPKIDILMKSRNYGKRDSQIMFLEYIKKYSKINVFDYSMFVDSDTFLEESCIENSLKEFQAYKNVIAICGYTSIDMTNAKTHIEYFQNFEYKLFHFFGKGFESSKMNSLITCLPGCFTIVKMEFLNDDFITLYSEDPINSRKTGRNYWLDQLFRSNLLQLGEDRYFTTILARRALQTSTDYKILYNSLCKIHTIAPNNLLTYVQQRRRWINSTICNTIRLLNSTTFFVKKPLLYISSLLDLIGVIFAIIILIVLYNLWRITPKQNNTIDFNETQNSLISLQTELRQPSIVSNSFTETNSTNPFIGTNRTYSSYISNDSEFDCSFSLGETIDFSIA